MKYLSLFILSGFVVGTPAIGYLAYILYCYYNSNNYNDDYFLPHTIALRRRSLSSLASEKTLEEKSDRIFIITVDFDWSNTCEKIFLDDLNVVKVLALDCEWVHSSRIALLQLSTFSGACFLIRLNTVHTSLNNLESSMPTLLMILSDPSYLKVGVATPEDAKLLFTNHNIMVRGCVDLRYLAARSKNMGDHLGLKKLAEKILNRKMMKNPKIQCGNWEMENLSADQVAYACDDVRTSFDILTTLILRKNIDFSHDDNNEDTQQFIDEKIEYFNRVHMEFLEYLNSTSYFSTPSILVLSESFGRKYFSDFVNFHKKFCFFSSIISTVFSLILENSKLLEVFYPERAPYACSCFSNQNVRSACQGIIDKKYKKRLSGNYNNINEINVRKLAAATAQKATRHRSNAAQSKNSPQYLFSQSPKLNHLKKTLYSNSCLLAPDGEKLCVCDVKKAQWYIDKGLGERVYNEEESNSTEDSNSSHQLTVKLFFEPSARPDLTSETSQYYIHDKVNECACCGEKDHLLRKNVVPLEYRKHFPINMKSHLSHDILLLCETCHAFSDMADVQLKRTLATKCDAPTISPTMAAKYIYDRDVIKIKSAAKALLTHGDRISSRRKHELENVILSYYNAKSGQEIGSPNTAVTEDVVTIDEFLLQDAMKLETKYNNSEFVSHGQLVVKWFESNENLEAFESMWRKHFVEVVKPKFLPKFWSIEHNHDSHACKYSKGNIDKN